MAKTEEGAHGSWSTGRIDEVRPVFGEVKWTQGVVDYARPVLDEISAHGSSTRPVLI